MNRKDILWRFISSKLSKNANKKIDRALFDDQGREEANAASQEEFGADFNLLSTDDQANIADKTQGSKSRTTCLRCGHEHHRVREGYTKCTESLRGGCDCNDYVNESMSYHLDIDEAQALFDKQFPEEATEEPQ